MGFPRLCMGIHEHNGAQYKSYAYQFCRRAWLAKQQHAHASRHGHLHRGDYGHLRGLDAAGHAPLVEKVGHNRRHAPIQEGCNQGRG